MVRAHQYKNIKCALRHALALPVSEGSSTVQPFVPVITARFCNCTDDGGTPGGTRRKIID
ncbi:MAG: hypothetical protein WBK78_00870 [Syntrophomonadaceae bacterium]